MSPDVGWFFLSKLTIQAMRRDVAERGKARQVSIETAIGSVRASYGCSS